MRTYSSDLLDLKVSDNASLALAGEYLHDAVFKISTVAYDRDRRCLEMVLWREVRDQTRRKKVFWFLQSVQVMRAQARFTVHHVSDISVRVVDKLDYYSIFGLEYFPSDKLLLLETEGCVDVRISVDTLCCQLADTGETTWEQFGYLMFGLARKVRKGGR